MVKHINKEDFEKFLKEDKDIAIIDFFATWCGPCKMLALVLEEISNEINVMKIDIDEERDFSIDMGIEVVPTMLIYKNGVEVNRIEGVISKHEILEEINKIRE